MINEVEGMPWEGKYPANVTASLLRYGADTLQFTHSYYEVRNPKGELIVGLGVAIWNLVRPPELWIMLAKPYFANLRQSLRITRAAQRLPISEYPGLVCDVARDSVVEQHFVEHCGWRPTGSASLRPAAEDFIQYGAP